MNIKSARHQPNRREDGRAIPAPGEVGIYWPDTGQTSIYSEGDFYEDEHLQTFASDQGAETIEPENRRTK